MGQQKAFTWTRKISGRKIKVIANAGFTWMGIKNQSSTTATVTGNTSVTLEDGNGNKKNYDSEPIDIKEGDTLTASAGPEGQAIDGLTIDTTNGATLDIIGIG